MATHRREHHSQLTPLTLLGMAASVLLIVLGIIAATQSRLDVSTGPLFEPLAVTGSAPPGPLILLDAPEKAGQPTTQSAPAPVAPHDVPYTQGVTNAVVPVKSVPKPATTVTPSKIFRPRSESLSESIQKQVQPDPDQQTFRAPTPDGPCSGTASQCLDTIESAPLTKAPDIGIDSHGLLCLIFGNTDCKARS